MRKSIDPTTHFEQVPLKIVKNIAKVDRPDDKTDGVDASLRPPEKKCAATRGLRARTINGI
jgi:hypothetical protein